jgi:hypothetical protein
MTSASTFRQYKRFLAHARHYSHSAPVSSDH